MLLVERWLLGRLCLGLLIIALPIFGSLDCPQQTRTIRITIRILCASVAQCGVLVWLLVLALPWPHFYAVPVYFPSRTMAARIHEYNASGFGGADSSVELFTSHGLKSNVVYFGEWVRVPYWFGAFIDKP
jgi:hypothetical protein